MKQNFALTLSLMGGLLLLTACVKEKTDDEKLRPVGSEIIFSAATSYENDDRTRTVYTGKDESGQYVTTNSSIERIDWENNDRVSIVYVPGSPSQAEYKVTNVLTSTDENDEADVVPSGSSKLVWAPAGSTDIFYAMYPTANGNHANNDADLVFSNNTANVQGVIPSSQPVDLSRTQSVPVPGSPNQTYNRYLPDMKYAYMVGYADGSCRDGSRVTIPFTPAVTAFNFIFKAASAVTVTGFEMSTAGAGNVGTTLAGDFNFDISGPKMRNNKVVGATWGTVNRTGPANDNGKTITVSFSQDITLSANQYLDFTVFTLPIMQKGITIKFHLKNVTNGVTTNYDKTLDLKDKTTGNWHEFAAGKKHVVTNDQLAGDTMTYTFSLSPTSTVTSQTLSFGDGGGTQNYSITSYKTLGTKTYPVTWQAYQYRVKLGNTWSSWSAVKPDCLTTDTGVQTPTSTAAITKSAKLTAGPIQGVGAQFPLGTSDAPYDLSTKSTTHGGTSMNTANCYVVSAPGWYCFPMVYGNAIEGGTTNTEAFYNNLTKTQYLKRFQDHNGGNGSTTGITQPYVDKAYTVGNPFVVWQDYDNLVSDVSPINVTVGSTTYKYVKFYVAPERSVPGNAVIAVKSGSDIAWSWHIWVTGQDMAPVTVRSVQFMRVNLGWCDGGDYKRVARTVEVQFKQSESNNIVTLTLSQSAGSTNAASLVNTNPHYQWGRKDPMIPPISGTANKTVYYPSGISAFVATEGPTTIQNGIKNPTVFYKHSVSGQSDWLSTSYCNLWNYTQDHSTSADELPVVDYSKDANNVNFAHGKTVYDPCPDGYTVPNIHDFKNMHKGTTNYHAKQTYTFVWSNNKITVDSNQWYPMGERVFNATDINAIKRFGEHGYYQTSGSHQVSAQNCILFAWPAEAWWGTSTTNPFNFPGLTQAPKTSARSIRCVKE